jgi:hypothetical protein
MVLVKLKPVYIAATTVNGEVRGGEIKPGDGDLSTPNVLRLLIVPTCFTAICIPVVKHKFPTACCFVVDLKKSC